MQVSCPHLEGCRVPKTQDGHLQSHKFPDHNQGIDRPLNCSCRCLTFELAWPNTAAYFQDDAVIISPRIDSLDCDDVGPYLPHGLGSVNSMMLDASVSRSRHNAFPSICGGPQCLSCTLSSNLSFLLRAAYTFACHIVFNVHKTLRTHAKHALTAHEL